MNVRPSSLVTLFVPESQYPPAQMTLMQVRVGLLQGRIPPAAVVQVVSGGEWLPAWQVVGDCVDFQPTRAGGVMVLFGVVPLVLLIGHIVLFGDVGILGPKILLAAGVLGLGVAWNTSLRTRPSSVLLRSPAFLATIGVVLLACEVPAIALGLMDRHEHAQIGAALGSADACDIEGIAQLIDKDGTDDEKNKASSRKSDCEQLQAKQACDRLVADIDRKTLTSEDQSWLSANARPEDVDIVSRLIKGSLIGSDLGRTPGGLPLCDGRMWTSLVRALASTPAVWSGTVQASSEMADALASVGLSPAAQASLQASAEAGAVACAKMTKGDDMRAAALTCQLCMTLHVTLGPGCTTLSARYPRIAAREQAIARAKEAQAQAGADAKDARCAAIEQALNTCLDPCLDIDLFDPRADACEARCKARFPTAGCE